MSARHTEGPYYAVGAMVEHANDKVADLCDCNPDNFGQGHLGRTYDEMAANARLFAAAPELLEALVFLANVARSTPGFPSPLALETADAAIAEARGAA